MAMNAPNNINRLDPFRYKDVPKLKMNKLRRYAIKKILKKKHDPDFKSTFKILRKYNFHGKWFSKKYWMRKLNEMKTPGMYKKYFLDIIQKYHYCMGLFPYEAKLFIRRMSIEMSRYHANVNFIILGRKILETHTDKSVAF